jgi:hypothetical protein
MIFDPTMQIVIGNMGWFDKGALWIFDRNCPGCLP